MTADLSPRIEQAADLIVGSKRLVVFTGAGISTESGIPDFRSPGGIWDRFDPDDFTIEKFRASADSRRKQWQMFGEGLLSDKAEPNPAHLAIAELYRLGKLDCVITQNIDNLHEKAGVPDDIVFELHGNMRWAVCLGCGLRYAFADIALRLENGEEIPDCPSCRGMLKPDIVMCGEQLPVQTLEEAARRSLAADVFFVIGSTLTVYPAALMPEYAVQAGAELVIINLSDTPMDNRAAVLIPARAGEAMSAIVDTVKTKLASP
ncbi:MAG: Sir2 family NAD-dependent protein deacetylase [Dehalococcoidales bacterium]|nr:Sir2 family NAD-dependent protein deacetylase [Dehalococcoidales bacterium]